MIFVFLSLTSLRTIISRSVYVAVSASLFYFINSLQLNVFKRVPHLHTENHRHTLQLSSIVNITQLCSYPCFSAVPYDYLGDLAGTQTPLWAHHLGSVCKPQFPHLQNVDHIAVSAAG